MRNKNVVDAKLKNKAAVYVEEVTFLTDPLEKEIMQSAIYQAMKWGEEQTSSLVPIVPVNEEQEEEFKDWEGLKKLILKLSPETYEYVYDIEDWV